MDNAAPNRLLAARTRISPLILALALIIVIAARTSGAVTPELQRSIRGATFEVVLKKPTTDPVSYEKPLPLELLPFIERTDLYRSVGTAFALGKNTYVTAAHVVMAAIGSQYGAPALRWSDGTVHPIGSVLKFSAHEDFVVFSLADNSEFPVLPTSRTRRVDDPVFAVGNALGDGIVIRDGLFTSETPEEQDGRWKWIRFSAAASPGNSGGPLLDAEGKVIGVVIAKSANENLNYALPIDNVLDAPGSAARFDQRRLVTLPYIHGSRTYNFKDEFPLPLPWTQFVRAFQTLTEKHNDHAREKLLSAYTDSLFPKGNGTEAILFQVDTAARDLGVVIQESDDNWTIESPQFHFTDLPGDGKVGITWVSGASLLRLSRANEAADNAFFGDSKAFMDVALKTLNLQRAVGSDRVRVTSLGPAVSDIQMKDRYGRKWQERVWAIPFEDSYLAALLLPVPDGYAGLLSYCPSIDLRECKVRLELLTNQVTVPYEGTLAQWQNFLARKALLPDAMQDITLESAVAWKLHTRRFESTVPASLLKLDTHSKLVLNMAYMYDGAKVVWDVGGAWWFRDSQQKAYVGLWRQPRPPSTAKLELRNQFGDLQGQRSPYDATPVRDSADTFLTSMTIQVPGSKEGMASADLAYGLTLRLDGHPSPDEIHLQQQASLQATRILEHGIGQDVATASAQTLSSYMNDFVDTELQRIQNMSQQFDEQYGRDIRGRLFSQDVKDYFVAGVRRATSNLAAQSGGEITKVMDGAESVTLEEYQRRLLERSAALQKYWRLAPGVVHNRDLWHDFLVHNHLAESTPHGEPVLAAESNLKAILASHPPDNDWADRALVLSKAYASERRRITRALKYDAAATYRPRQTPCPAAASKTSGKDTPVIGPIEHALDEFYPPRLARESVEGIVVLSVRVSASGCVTEAAVTGSSGSDEFDAAALRWIETASYLPAERAGAAVVSTANLAVDFKLRD
ncbi:MAG: TonB family protein [Steroidobacteraceae bacterium]